MPIQHRSEHDSITLSRWAEDVDNCDFYAPHARNDDGPPSILSRHCIACRRVHEYISYLLPRGMDVLVAIYLPDMFLKYVGILASLACSSSALFIKRDDRNLARGVVWRNISRSLAPFNPSDDDLGCPSECSIWKSVETIATNYPWISYNFCSPEVRDEFTGCRDCLENSHGHIRANYVDELQNTEYFIQNDGLCGLFNNSTLYNPSGPNDPFPSDGNGTSPFNSTTSPIASSSETNSPSAETEDYSDEYVDIDTSSEEPYSTDSLTSSTSITFRSAMLTATVAARTTSQTATSTNGGTSLSIHSYSVRWLILSAIAYIVYL